MLECVLSVDIGTTSLKAGIISSDGEVVFIFKKSFYDHTNRFVATQWLQALKSALKDFDRNSEIKIIAISISGNGPTVVSKAGLTFRWNEPCNVDLSKAGPSLFIPRLMAFKELFSAEYNRTQFIFSGPEYFIYELTGNPVTLLPEARFLPAYWDEDSLALAQIDGSKLPPYIEPGKVCGNLKADTAAFLELEEGIPVFCGGPDFVAALIGTNTLKHGQLCDRSGSSEGLNFCINPRLTGEGLRTLPSVISTLWNCSYLIPGSSKLKTKARLETVKKGINLLKETASENNIEFPDTMVVTGGQSKDNAFLQKKADALNMNIVVCNCNDAELLGDTCVALYGIGKFSSINEAADAIVKESKRFTPRIGNVKK